jgi:hypothetical protein
VSKLGGWVLRLLLMMLAMTVVMMMMFVWLGSMLGMGFDSVFSLKVEIVINGWSLFFWRQIFNESDTNVTSN